MSLIGRTILKIRIAAANNEKYINLLRRRGVKIGSGCVIDKTAEFGTEPYLITLDDHVRVTRGVCFITHDGGLWTPRNMGLVDKKADRFGRIHVCENVNIGWNAIIMPGVTIGKDCIIGAGAVVTKDIPDHSVAIGVPAKVYESIEEYAQKNSKRILNTKGMSQEEKRSLLENNPDL